MTKLRIELEGDAYADGLATADKFIETIIDAVDAIADAIKHLQNAKEILDASE